MNLWWRRNDGMSGHAWLGPREVWLLRQEMLAQGMASELPTTVEAIEAALRGASAAPITLADKKLWEDFLAFLEGAAENGGILIR